MAEELSEIHRLYQELRAEESRIENGINKKRWDEINKREVRILKRVIPLLEKDGYSLEGWGPTFYTFRRGKTTLLFHINVREPGIKMEFSYKGEPVTQEYAVDTKDLEKSVSENIARWHRY